MKIVSLNKWYLPDVPRHKEVAFIFRCVKTCNLQTWWLILVSGKIKIKMVSEIYLGIFPYIFCSFYILTILLKIVTTYVKQLMSNMTDDNRQLYRIFAKIVNLFFGTDTGRRFLHFKCLFNPTLVLVPSYVPSEVVKVYSSIP